MRDTVIKTVLSEKLLVILRGIPEDKLIPLAEAMYAGGVRMLEITYSANGSISDADTAKRIKTLVNHFNGRMLIGAGTVLTERQVELTREAGGLFIISPDACPEVIKKTRELGLVSMPGALTPTEIQAAHKAGADFVKLFPISNLGADYVRAVTAPLSHIRLLAVGGVNTDNMKLYRESGACGFGVGANIAGKDLLEAGDWTAITERVRKFVAAAKGE